VLLTLEKLEARIKTMEIPRVNALSSEAQSAVRQIAERLQEHGVRGWIVGGAVRDLALGLEPKDIDMASAATPAQIEDWFEVSHEVGRAFGTVVVRVHGLDVQLTTFRVERGYSDRRRPDAVEFGTSLEEDAKRRDFTCNALYLDPASDEVCDPEGGLRDLEAGLLRCVGRAEDRFREDGLRLLRLARLAARFGLQPESETYRAARENADALVGVSPERVLAELVDMLARPGAASAIRMLFDLELVPRAIPGWNLEAAEADTRVEVLQQLESHARVELGLAALFGADPRGTDDQAGLLPLLLGLKPSKKLFSGAAAPARLLLRAHLLGNGRAPSTRAQRLRIVRDPEWASARVLGRAWAAATGVGSEQLDGLDELRRASSQVELWPEPWLAPADILAAGVEQGPELGKLVFELEEAQLNLECNSEGEARKWLNERVRGA